MIKNYLKIALRHISRNKSYLLINVVGLGLAFACCIVAFINFQYVNKADHFHENLDQIYRVAVGSVGGHRPNGNVVAPLMPQAVAEIGAVKEGVRISRRGVVVKVGEKVFSDDMAQVDPNFLAIFTFPIISGTAGVLQDPAHIILSNTIAQKYFGSQDPIGKVVTIEPGKPWQKDLIVGGVVEDPPSNSTIKFDLLTHISFAETGQYPRDLSAWNNTLSATFVVLNEGASMDDVVQGMNKYLPLENKFERHREVTKYHLQPMSVVYKNGDDIQNNRLNSSIHPLMPVAPGVMALLILLTACLNFTNTTISFSNKRLKEMGVRKVMGSNRKQLITQLLSESFIICLLALVFGIVVANYVTPYYNQMWEYMELEVALNYFDQPDLVSFLAITVLVTSLVGGAYPAFYMSSFKPTSIFRGSTKFGGDTWLVRFLLGLQIVISLVAIIGGIAFYQNSEFQRNYDLGYDAKGIINIPIDGAETYHQLKAAIATNPDIEGIAGSINNLGFGNWWTNLGKAEDKRGVQVQYVGENFLEVMDIAVIEGRDFDKNRELDYTESAIINKKLLKEQQWESGIGQELEVGGNKLKVIGVTENFVPSSMFDQLSPNVFQFRKPEEFQLVKIKVSADKLLPTNDYLKATWAANFPYVPYEGYYQDEVLAESLTVSQNISWIFIFLALIAILLSATGLYSLVSLNFLKRAKEIAVRRVVGASTQNIAYLLNKQYLLVFLIGGILGAVGGVYAAQFLLEEIFEIHQGVQTSSTIMAVGFICMIGAITIAGKLFGVLRTNPAETLRSD